MHAGIILAAGEGKRAKPHDKLMADCGGKPLLWHSLRTFYEHPQIDRIVLVSSSKKKGILHKLLREWKMENVELVIGGKSRQASLHAAVRALGDLAEDDILVVHNAANPFVESGDITRVIDAARKFGAAGMGHPVVDTLKRVQGQLSQGDFSQGGLVFETLERDDVWHAQTPEALHAGIYWQAHKKNIQATDEMGLAEAVGVKPRMLLASPYNRKITYSHDLEWARAVVVRGQGDERHTTLSDIAVRTGIGMDSHRFDRSHRGLALGGLILKDHPKMQANSDGDVMLHALCNAILQALGEGSFGPLADPMAEQGIHESTAYLAAVLEKMHTKNFTLQHVGFQLEGAEPQIDPLASTLKVRLAELLALSADHIGITATTGEDLTPFGRGEGLQCVAVATLRPHIFQS